jgi:hypothetical protein
MSMKSPMSLENEIKGVNSDLKPLFARLSPDKRSDGLHLIQAWIKCKLFPERSQNYEEAFLGHALK